MAREGLQMVERGEENPAQPGQPSEGCQVAESPGGRLQVRVSGLLYAGWSSRLAAALARRRISVVSGRGARRAGNVWDVELLLEPLDRTVDAWALDYLRLARDGKPPTDAEAANLVLDSFTLTRTADELVVDVEAVDRIGFLDTILRVFAFYSLYPRELRIETRGQKVRDQFRLQSLAGTAPSLQVCEAVGLKLRDLAGPQHQ
jgi:hypothetical protein